MKISQTESQIYGYKIGRNSNYLESFKADEIEMELYQSSLDICRIKTNGNQESLIQELQELQIPYDIFTINYLNEGPINFDQSLDIDANFSYQIVENPNENEAFILVLKDILQSKSWFEYKSPLAQHCMPQSLRENAALDYYSSFSKINNLNNSSVLLLKNNEPIGIMVGYKTDHIYNGVIFGILSKYRKLGYAKYAYLMMQEEWQKMEVNYFQNDVSIFNMASQKSNYAQNISEKGIYVNITLYPFLDLEHKQCESLAIGTNNLEGLILYLLNRFPGFTIRELKHNTSRKKTGPPATASLRIIVDDNLYKFLVIHFLSTNEVQESYYISMRK